MNKTLEDFAKETRPKTEVQLIKELSDKKYRAINALYIGLGAILFLFSLKLFHTVGLWKYNISSINDYLLLRKKLYLFSIAERIVWVFVITYYANKLNRIPFGWQCFAFFTPYLALIVIGLTPKKDNYFFEYKKATDKESFFKGLKLSEKLRLYKHLLKKTFYTPYWYDKISQLTRILFADENTALETLQEYEKMYKSNLLVDLKKINPTNAKEEFFKPIIDLGLVNSDFYKVGENSSS